MTRRSRWRMADRSVGQKIGLLTTLLLLGLVLVVGFTIGSLWAHESDSRVIDRAGSLRMEVVRSTLAANRLRAGDGAAGAVLRESTREFDRVLGVLTGDQAGDFDPVRDEDVLAALRRLGEQWSAFEKRAHRFEARTPAVLASIAEVDRLGRILSQRASRIGEVNTDPARDGVLEAMQDLPASVREALHAFWRGHQESRTLLEADLERLKEKCRSAESAEGSPDDTAMAEYSADLDRFDVGVQSVLAEGAMALEDLARLNEGHVQILEHADEAVHLLAEGKRREIDRLLILDIVSLVVVLVLGLILARIISGQITRPLARVVEATARIGEGDLSVEPLRLDRTDELGELAGTFDRMVADLRAKIDRIARVAEGDLSQSFEDASGRDALARSLGNMSERLRALVSSIQEESRSIASAGAQIFASSREQEAIVAQQSTAIQQVTSSIAELNRSHRLISSNSASMGTALQETRQELDESRREVEVAVESLDSINRKSEAMAERIERLSEKVRQIEKIVRTVREMTDQVNVLALNASIEAARAGEQGRGFAVVAGEIRRLAERTDRSTGHIVEILEDVEESTGRTVLSNEETLRSVRIGVECVQANSRAFETIRGRVEHVIEGVEQIFLSIRQEEGAFGEIESSVREINQGMKETQAGTKQNVSAAEHLKRSAAGLAEQAGRFKV